MTTVKINSTYLHKKSIKTYRVIDFIEDKDTDTLKVVYTFDGAIPTFKRKFCRAIDLFLEGFELVKHKGFTKLSFKKPNVEEHGEKLLIHRLVNDSQEAMSYSLFNTDKIHLCNPKETWWMELPDTNLLKQKQWHNK